MKKYHFRKGNSVRIRHEYVFCEDYQDIYEAYWVDASCLQDVDQVLWFDTHEQAELYRIDMIQKLEEERRKLLNTPIVEVER